MPEFPWIHGSDYCRLIQQAQGEHGRAGNDETTFTKAEADLRAPSAMGQPGHDSMSASKKAIAWIPIDGEYTVDETFAPAPQKMEAIGQANKDAHRGNAGKAAALLKVSDVTADHTLTVAPLEKTDAAVARAAELMNADDYDGAGQALRSAENGVRYDIADLSVPKPIAAAETRSATAASPVKSSSE